MSFSSSEILDESSSARHKVHRVLFILGLVLVCIGMPNGKVFMSIGQFLLGLNWIAEGDFGPKWKKFVSNKPALVLVSFYIMHLVGMLYSTDFKYGLEDIRVKIPLLIMPFIFCTTNPLTTKEQNIVLGLFMGGLTVATIQGTLNVMHHAVVDIHEITPHVSSIRLGLMLVLSVFLLFGYVFSNKWSWLSLLLMLWAAWFLVFLLIMQSLTGIVLFFIIGAAIIIYYAFKELKQRKPAYSLGLFAAIAVITISAGMYLNHFQHKYFPRADALKWDTLQVFSAKGSAYYGGPAFAGVENGHWVHAYVAPDELYLEWGRRSKMKLDSLDRKGNTMLYTLVRYMTSKNLRKDSSGMVKMTDKDIQAVEDGIPNYNFVNSSSMRFRLYQAFWEIEDFKYGGNVSGHSIMQRFEFWRAAIGIIKQHWLIGVGTGDVRKAFDKQYIDMNTSLAEDFRLRAHNQFLEIGVASGIIGILWLLFSVIYPAIKTRKLFTYAYFVFWMIFVLSMTSEDTLETQAGATFYAFFNSFFLFLI